MRRERFEQEKSGPSLFVGICKTCGEIYEARSVLEDLEGVTFKCKKVLCEGRVSLVSASPSDEVDSKGDKLPNRFN